MKLLTFCIILQTALTMNTPGTVLPAPSDSTNSSDLPSYVGCVNRTPEVSLAIWHFCNRQNLTVPSAYASRFDYGNVTMGIEASCNPPKHVSEKACRNRFFGMCVSSSDNTVKILKSFGKDHCQNWIIHRGDAVNGTIIPINGTRPINGTQPHNATQSRNATQVKHS